MLQQVLVLKLFEDAMYPLGLSVLMFTSSDRSAIESTRVKRSVYRQRILAVVTEVVLPMLSIVASLINILQLFFMKEFELGGVGLALFFLPTFPSLLYYLENMLHRKNNFLELILITALGPCLRHACIFSLTR